MFIGGIIIGVLLAILSFFDYNPLALLGWIWNSIIVPFVTWVANLARNTDWFREIFQR
mgnify:FL=1|jgi:hypothetical protein